MSAPAIRVEGVKKAFDLPTVYRETVREHFFAFFRPRRFERLRVLDGVSFEMKQGETLGIMGRNGSGKSTLLKLLCGIFPPDSGTLSVVGHITPILELGVGWNPELDAIDNVQLIGTALGMRLAESRKRTEEILAFAQVERFAHLPLKHFSSGMAQRLAYAVAFAAVRDVLVLDEIFAVGDATFKAKCQDYFVKLRREGKTIVLVSHDPTPILSYCDRAALLEGGVIAAMGKGSDIVSRYLQLAPEAARLGPGSAS